MHGLNTINLRFKQIILINLYYNIMHNLVNVKTISHQRNNLEETVKIINKYKNIDMIEIDVLYNNGKFIVAHNYFYTDYNYLEDWIHILMELDMKMWLDLKDGFIYNKFPMDKFTKFMNNMVSYYKKLNMDLYSYVIIGSNFSSIKKNIYYYDDLLKFTIIYDTPAITHYIIDKLVNNKYTSLKYFYNKIIQKYYSYMFRSLASNIIVSLDYSFFNNIKELEDMLLFINSETVIICLPYSNLDSCTSDIKNNIKNNNKNLIFHYNFIL
jgi:hypothetical protein